jgi:antitoxin VapB
VDTSDIYFFELQRVNPWAAPKLRSCLIKHGGSQAVRLPKDFRLPGTEVRVRRLGRGVLLEPMEPNVEDVKAIFAEIDRLGGNAFLPKGRPVQPPMPPADDVSLE